MEKITGQDLMHITKYHQIFRQNSDSHYT